jgi:hypothetical protein
MPKPLEWPNYGPVSVGNPRPRNSSATSGNFGPKRKKSSAIWLALQATVIASLTACGTTSTATYVKPDVPASLTEPCPDLPEIYSGNLAEWAVQVITMYVECAAGKQRLADAVGTR